MEYGEKYQKQFQKLKQFMVIEGFKNCILKNINKSKVEMAYKLVVLAGKCAVTYKRTKPSYPHNLGTQTPSRLRDMNYKRGGSN